MKVSPERLELDQSQVQLLNQSGRLGPNSSNATLGLHSSKAANTLKDDPYEFQMANGLTVE